MRDHPPREETGARVTGAAATTDPGAQAERDHPITDVGVTAVPRVSVTAKAAPTPTVDGANKVRSLGVAAKMVIDAWEATKLTASRLTQT